ncbi:YiiX/YebB-like N1pC/P60 family cysteine hydrolase [Vagococcus hydrophili]|uniref:Uncharacterized protein n=1 Tax=Vagococcus hydrophili TaxID=2714947 RepID=A0A6G8ARY2_9ENTE|nr:YiiX/YebB-like N1pC/P60 family cysteine hydrolase [Vagococcus hydrophili]QIL47729.1 hypothetical protein G7082_03835 [Vagococcus hydrophili]
MEVYRYKERTEDLVDEVIAFCVSQLGKSYSLDFSHSSDDQKASWYCSLLVWAAYKNSGIDLESQHIWAHPGITPKEIRNSPKVYRVI